jgi:molecular chaperone DnaK (HSP70)
VTRDSGAGAARIAECLAERFLERHGVDPRGDARAWRLIQEAAARAWRDLAAVPVTVVALPCLMSAGRRPLHLDVTLTREDAGFEHPGGSRAGSTGSVRG